MKNSISKKALSAFLAIMMIFATMAGMFTFSASADAISGNWTEHYDLSWITPYDGTPASTANYVQVGEKYYQVLGYSASETNVFYIDNAAELAGLAKLTNESQTASRAEPYFSNCTIYITAAKLDLSNHYWIPIASNAHGQSTNTKCKIFGGHLIGANTADPNGIVTIDGMTINQDVGADTGRNYAAGLIGMQGGGSVQNLTLTNASITTNTSYSVGSFVGSQWGPAINAGNHTLESDAERCSTIYTNLSSDAVINKTGTGANVTNSTGGIVGTAVSGYYVTTATFTNCTFTGSITAKQANVAGILGYASTGGGTNTGVFVYLTNCDVNADITVQNATLNDTCSTGGLIGATKANVVAEDCDVVADISATINTTSTLVNTAGMIGLGNGLNKPDADTSASISFTDCTFTGSVSANKNVIGLYIGVMKNAVDVNLNNCKVAGDASKLQNICWIGEATNVTLKNTNNSSSFLTKYYDGATSVPAIKDANETTIKDLGIQMSNDGTKMRVSAQILGKEYDKAGFEFYVTYTVDDVVKSSKINAKDVSICYTSIKAGDETIYADSGYYYIVFVIDGFDSATMSDISIGFAASVTKDATVTWSDSAYCDATVEVTQPG